MTYAADDQEAVLGRLLMDIVHGELTDDTIEMVDQLDPDDLYLPMLHLIRYVQGMNRDPKLRDSINRSLLDELRIITIEQTENLYPISEELPSWQPDATIPTRAISIVKDFVLEILQGEISYKTLTALDHLGELEDVPEPYRELISLAQGSREDGQEIAGFLLHNLSGIIGQIKKMKQ